MRPPKGIDWNFRCPLCDRKLPKHADRCPSCSGEAATIWKRTQGENRKREVQN